MTANEMRNLFKELYDGASAQEMGFDDIEVNRFLNLSQQIIFNDKYFSLRNPQLEGFEIGSKRDVELSNLKTSGTLWKDNTTDEWLFRTLNSTYANGKFEETTTPMNLTYETIIDFPAVLFTIPENMLFITKDNVDIKLDNNVYRNVKIKNINEANTNDILSNPFMKPDISVIYRSYQTIHDESSNLINTKLIKLYLPENSEFYRWNVNYVRRPINIVVNILDPVNQINCELDDLIHNDIVFKAVELALGSIGSQKIQIANYNNKTNIN